MMLLRGIRWYLIALVLCVANYLNVQAQQSFRIEHLTTEDGLSQGMVYDVLQDQEGFMWIATKDGLNRYDGYDFEVFTNDPNDPWSISGNTVELLFEDSAGRIWAASSNAGLDIYDKKTGRFHHISYNPEEPTGLTGSNITSIVEDTSGFFIVGIEERELNMFRLDDRFFEHQEEPRIIRIQMPPQKRKEQQLFTLLKGLARDAKGRIWVGGQDAIYQLDVQRAELTLAVEGYSIGTFVSNPDGSIWACGDIQSLFHWDGEQASTYLEGFRFSGAGDMSIDDQHNLWFLRPDSLFSMDLSDWHPGKVFGAADEHYWLRWQPEAYFNNYPLQSLTIDRTGLIWVGSSGYGLYKINPNQLKFSHFLPGVSVRQISIDADELFLQDYGTGWYKQNGTYLNMDPLGGDGNKLSNDYLLVARSGEYWIRQPFYQGQFAFKLKRYNPITREVRYYDIDSYHYDSQPIIECRDSSIWMAGFNDVLARLDPESGDFISFDLKTGQRKNNKKEDTRISSEDYSTALYEDQNGILWVGTERGFTKVIRSTGKEIDFQITKYQNVTDDPTSLSYNHVSCFLDDPFQPDRFLWISTKGGGINRLDKASGAFLRLNKKDGLPDNVVYGLLPDDEGNIWGSTNKGLFRMSINQTEAKVTDSKSNYAFLNFSKSDGLQDNEFNTGAYAKLPDGRLAFGGINGYNVFDPKEIISDNYQPQTFITNVLVNNNKILPGDESGILENTIESTRQITLNHLQDILTLEFVALDFKDADQIKYRYQLVGADETWVEAGNRRSATFLHLPPKDYIFRVQGTNSQGVWSDHIAELEIRILPPWWKTWWAYLIYVVLIAFLIWIYLRFLIKRTKLEQELSFEKREAERVRELDALKTRLFTNMTHEFRTPLTIIIGMTQQVMDNPKQHFKDGMNLILNNGQNLLGLVNKMLNLAKLESGKITLELVQGDIVLHLKNAVESFQSYATKKAIRLHFLPEVDEVIMDYDPEKIQQIVSNLISNAFKFTPEGGNIYFSVRQENDSIHIRVKDTGRGIPLEDQTKIFDRFYQSDNSSTRQYEGTGIGLALCKDLVTLMNGEITVQSPPIGSNNGSEFKVSLPIHQKAMIKEAEQTESLEQASETPIGNGQNGYATTIESNKTSVALKGKQKDHFEDTAPPLILLVEDNADVRAYISSCLNDYRLIVAENGQAGFEKATEIIPDLIISDVMMPIMDGFELCQKLKTDDRTNYIPVIMLTARADIDSKLEGLELGANAYLPKPFEKQELLLTIKNLFELRNKLRLHYQNVAGLAEAAEEVLENTELRKSEDAFVIKVREFIEANLSDFNLTVEQLAKEIHLSHSQFGRKLDALTGFTPNRFIRNIRLKKAKELLLNPELSITAIAFDCGFSDPSYFTRVFKKEFGKTPVEWRAQDIL